MLPIGVIGVTAASLYKTFDFLYSCFDSLNSSWFLSSVGVQLCGTRERC